MDMHTLHVEHAALLGLFTLLTIVNSLLHRGTRGAYWFTTYTASAFVGAVLISLRGDLPDSLSIVLGALLFAVAYACLHRSLTEFFEAGRQQWWLQLGIAALTAGVLIRWGLFEPDTRHRLLAFSLLLALQLALSATFVLRQAAGSQRWSARMMGLLLLTLSANNLFRGLLVMWKGLPRNYLQSGPGMSWALLITTVLQGAITIAYVWMTAARLQGELEMQASTDPLTRLLNRRAIELYADREIARSRRSGSPVSAIMVDLDAFKQINDVWGHPCGDKVLREVARCFESQMRAGDFLGRLGGDEFVVLLPRTSRHEALGIAEQLRGCLEGMRFPPGEGPAEVHASFGAAELDPRFEWNHLIETCDQALYAVKDLGGNQVLVH